MRDLVFLDVETTGLDPRKHEILELYALRTSPSGQHEKVDLALKLRPRDIAAADPQALAVNDYTEAAWAPELCTHHYCAADELVKIMAGAVPVGHNIGFDLSFIEALLASEGLTPTWHYHKIDTASLVWPLYFKGEVSSLSLAAICTQLSIPHETAHQAKSDVMACRELFHRLMARYT